MKNFVVKRLLQLIPILLGLSLLTFSLLYIAPGDAALKKLASMEETITEERLEKMREEMGLNRSFAAQYLSWLSGVLHGDLGTCYRDGLPVAGKIRDGLKNTLTLSLASILVSLLLSIPLGILSAARQNKWSDYLIRFFCFLGNSVPGFLLAVILMYFFCIRTKLLPVISKQNLKGMILPVATLSTPMICRFTRQIRADVLEQLGKEYVHGLRSRGVKESYILFRNVFRGAMVSIVTVIGLSIGSTMAGSVVIETIFGWPGIGKLVMDSVTARDYPVIQGFVLIMGTVYVTVNLLTDISYFYLDPRVEEEY